MKTLSRIYANMNVLINQMYVIYTSDSGQKRNSLYKPHVDHFMNQLFDDLKFFVGKVYESNQLIEKQSFYESQIIEQLLSEDTFMIDFLNYLIRSGFDDESHVKNQLQIVQKKMKKKLVQYYKDLLKTETRIVSAKSNRLQKKFAENLKAIQIIKDLNKSNIAISDEDIVNLKKYSGFGGLPHVFDERNEDFSLCRSKLKELVSKTEYEQLKASTLNAHYTPDHIIDFMIDVAKVLGFNKGRIVEPACGNGKILSKLCGIDGCNITALEIESLSAAMASAMNPNANVINSAYEHYSPKEKADLVLTNVPFGNYQVYDKEYNHYGLMIHDYFIVKSLDMLSENGLLIVITSMGTLEKKSRKVLKLINERGRIIGAIRLPNNAFTKIAQTSVASVILVIRRMNDGYENSDFDMTENGDVKYFFEHPKMFIQRNKGSYQNNQYGKPVFVVNGDKEWVADLKKLSASFDKPEYYYLQNNLDNADQETEDNGVIMNPNIKPYSFFVERETVYQRVEDEAVLCTLTGVRYSRLPYLIQLREMVEEIIEVQSTYHDDSKFNQIRFKLNKKYDAFVKQFGFISLKKNHKDFKEDPGFSLIMSLEERDGQDNYVKSSVFSERTIYPKRRLNKCDSVMDALLCSLDQKGSIDFDFIMELTNQSLEIVKEELKDNICFDPISNEYITKLDYLSGNIRKKLEQVELITDDKLKLRQKELLESVLPEEVQAKDIVINIGAFWIPEDIICSFIDFIKEKDTKTAKVIYSPQTGSWYVDVGYMSSVLENTKYGTSRFGFSSVIDAVLNQKPVKLYDTIREDGKEKRVFNEKETLLAREKCDYVSQKFSEWLYRDTNRVKRLQDIYNRLFNSTVKRTYDGRYLTFDGINQNITLRNLQLRGVARSLIDKNVLTDYVVGAGKTFTLIAAAMKLKQLGMVNKTILTVPNHLVKQWNNDFMLLFPRAKVLMTDDKDFTPKMRKRFLSRIATGNWDAIIIPHSSFGKIRMSEDYSREFIQEEIFKVEMAVNALNEREYSRSKSRAVKSLEKTKKNLKVKLERLENITAKDEFLTFESLGCDMLMVDEAHEFKNLIFHTKKGNISGINNSSSQKAYDMYMKVRYIAKKGRGTIFATATPIANSISEMFTMQRYMQQETLDEMGINHFDTWASVFGETVTKLEISPDGNSYRINTRFCKFNNIPELLKLYHSFADVVTKEDINLELPVIKGGKATIVECEPSDELKDYIQSLVKRAERVHSGQVSKEDDNMLLISTDGRKAALDYRLIDPDAPEYMGYKVNIAANEVFERFRRYKHLKLTQIVFCDLSTPKTSGFSVYNELNSLLLAKGVPEQEIAFIHDAKSHSQRLMLYEKVKKGIVRVLIGSTRKMGTGMNAQDRLCVIHHLDPPWRPGDIEQRDGRGVRQGNLCPTFGVEFEILQYVTKQSFDAYSWQILENKAMFINQVKNGSMDRRHSTDDTDLAFSYAEIKALASGNPLVIKKFELESKIKELRMMQSRFNMNQTSIRYRISSLKEETETIRERILQLKRMIKVRKAHGLTDDYQVCDMSYQEKKKAATHIIGLAERLTYRQQREIGRYRGFIMVIKSDFVYGKNTMSVDIKMEDGRCFLELDLPRQSHRFYEKIDDRINGIEEMIKNRESKLTQIASELEICEREKDTKFEREHELITQQLELESIERLLNPEQNQESVSEDGVAS